MIEADVEDYLARRVKARGGEVRKVAWLGRKHAPDRLVMLGCKHPLVELKRPGEKPCAGQLREHGRLRAAGFEVFVIDTREGVDRLVDAL